MRQLSIFVAILLTSLSAQALQVVKSGRHQAQLQAPAVIDFTIVQVTAACLFTFDPQWADKEDTGAARLIFESADEAKEYETLLKSQGLKAYGLGSGEACAYRNGRPDSTFPRVRTADGKEYFSQYTPLRSLVEAARQQKAFKKVPLVLAKGFDELRQNIGQILNSFEGEVVQELKK